MFSPAKPWWLRPSFLFVIKSRCWDTDPSVTVRMPCQARPCHYAGVHVAFPQRHQPGVSLDASWGTPLLDKISNGSRQDPQTTPYLDSNKFLKTSPQSSSIPYKEAHQSIKLIIKGPHCLPCRSIRQAGERNIHVQGSGYILSWRMRCWGVSSGHVPAKR